MKPVRKEVMEVCDRLRDLMIDELSELKFKAEQQHDMPVALEIEGAIEDLLNAIGVLHDNMKMG